MKVRFGEDVFDIQWQYDAVLSLTTETPVVQTTCRSSRVDPEKQGRKRYFPLTSAYVTQNPIDRHDKEKARKLSLAKALSGWLIAKDQRKLVWEVYLSRRSTPAQLQKTL